MQQHWWKWLLGSLVILVGVGMFWPSDAETQAELLVQPQSGPFRVTVTSTGELKAKNSVKIFGPSRARQARIYEMKLLRIVPEGTVVRQGDFVAQIDQSELNSRVQDAQIELQKAESQYTQTKLDTSLTLSKARDELINLQYAMEEARLRKEQNVYESPSVQRQADIDFEKAERAHSRAVDNYGTQVAQAEAQMQEVEAELAKTRKQFDDYVAIGQEFTIMAPENGMVIYKRSWNGEKLQEGGTVNSWDPVVAELPDLTVMQSVTYVNEVDIQKVKPGQRVEIGLDADADRRLTGRVEQVANIGEQRPNSDAKVFEVSIIVNEADSTLRPAMTTSNTIIVADTEDQLYIPLESLHTDGEASFVFIKDGNRMLRQRVTLGLLNENEAIVESGLTLDDRLYLSLPADTSGVAWRE